MKRLEESAGLSKRDCLLLLLVSQLPLLLIILPFVLIRRMDGVEVMAVAGAIVFQGNCQFALMLRSSGQRRAAWIALGTAAVGLAIALFAIFLALVARG